MSYNNTFSAETISVFRSRISKIIQHIKDYRQELRDSKDLQIKPDPTRDTKLDALQEAFTDLNKFYSNGKQQWFIQHNNILGNYGFDGSLGTIWLKIKDEYNAFWNELDEVDKAGISSGRLTFWLPNLHNKSFEGLKADLDKDLKTVLENIDPSYTPYTLQHYDGFQIQVPAITGDFMYTIAFQKSKVDVSTSTEAKPFLKEEITQALFRFLCGYLGV